MTGAWQGPSPVLLWSQGNDCVFPEGAENPIWFSSWFVKTHGAHQPSDAEAPPSAGRGEEPKPAENQANGDAVTESNKEPPLPDLQEATSSHYQTQQNNPGIYPVYNLGSNKMLDGYGQEGY
jgi:hypothetical protein